MLSSHGLKLRSMMSHWRTPSRFTASVSSVCTNGASSPMSYNSTLANTSRVNDWHDPLHEFGYNVFNQKTAGEYLAKYGLPSDILNTSRWTRDGSADKVASAVMDWARDRGAHVYCHWFQPLGSGGLRHGQSAQVQNHMVGFDDNGETVWSFDGKQLLQGETDGSSFPNGGLRHTSSAGGYLVLDSSSPMFVRGDTLFIPACLLSFHADSLDEKTPLLRANDALSLQGTRLLNLLGFQTEKLEQRIGLEQEFFFVSRDAYNRRPDLQFAGRTVMGYMPARGQELCDHYMAPPSLAAPAFECMREVQEECFRIGIPLRTRHREVAPNQYEFAPIYGPVTQQVDQNLMVMQVLEEVAARHNLVVLLQEKPFAGVNGSGKHNNWSIVTESGVNLFNINHMKKMDPSGTLFPIILAALIRAVDRHGDLLRMSIASPGNDFRLGACEAPPSIVSMYLGEDLTKYLTDFMNGKIGTYDPSVKTLQLNVSSLPDVSIPAEDRNRTSPLPFSGHRFEFRAVGSSQNASLVNTVLGSIAAEAFAEFADQIESGKSPVEVAQNALRESFKTIFNGNNYDDENQEMLTKRGLWRIDSTVDAICRFTEPKNIELFTSLGVLTEVECHARQKIMLEHYTGVARIEARCMVDMIQQHILPACRQAGIGPGAELENGVKELKTCLEEIENCTDLREQANIARNMRLETMIKIREICDEAEEIIPSKLWTLATYKELMFMDQHIDF